MATPREYLDSIIEQAGDLREHPAHFLDTIVDELKSIDSLLDDLISQPHCDECGVLDEEAEEWCGNCGRCMDHCELWDSCEEWHTEMLELMQGGN